MNRERADLRGFGYPRYTGASCPHVLGSAVAEEDPAADLNVIVHGPASPVPVDCRLLAVMAKERESCF